MLKLKIELYRTGCVNLIGVLSDTDSHLGNSLGLVFGQLKLSVGIKVKCEID